ncbi:MAG: DUF4097 family beta strand repeat protein [Caldilineae bacterium]|nr:DUF4097 family beta strand repeat protein [Chloroflexota bacterium]MCB9175953.1 DUF4097 family beta strand repeat protein [Caldilineae bacterium]
MRKGRIITAILALALVGVCGASLLIVYASYDALRASGVALAWGVHDSRAVVTETLRVDRDLPKRLVIDSSGGDIIVSGGSRQGVEVEMAKQAWERDAEAARAAAEAMAVEVERQGDTLTLRWKHPETLDLGVQRGGRDAVAFSLRLPASLALALSTGNGDLVLEGMAAPAELETGFGSVRVDGHAGPLSIESRNAELAVERVEAGAGTIALSTDFGGIEAKALHGGALSLSSRNGRIEASDLRAAGALAIDSDFGDLALTQLRAAGLVLGSRNGAVTLDGGRIDGPLAVSNDFGDTRIEGVSARGYAIDARNGRVTLVGPSGSVRVDSQFGDVEIRQAQAVRLQVETANGAIEVSGSLAAGAGHRLHSDFGAIHLALPADSDLDLVLSTDFGTVTSDLPVSVAGRMDGRALEGRLGAGGTRLEVGTKSGDIRLSALSSNVRPD